ncbi:MAG: hypothetical protein LBL83_07560 [Clostridiales bacterium]|jgi:hypothetical protein|nr:hypothetical protein [Clostridiales bacterium]
MGQIEIARQEGELPGIRAPDAVLERCDDGYYIVLPFNRTGLVSRIPA